MNETSSADNAAAKQASKRPPLPSGATAERFAKWKLWAVIGVCAAPVIASYAAFYFIKPEARSNYGALIEPQRDLPRLALTELNGQAFDIDKLKGKWVMVHTDAGACPDACAKQLYIMRQLRATQGKEMDRIDLVWLIRDDAEVPSPVRNAYEGVHMLRGSVQGIDAWLPAGEAPVTQHIFLVDPLGHLMMRWPAEPDPNGMKRDLAKLLRASRIG
jgi:hypothetical protein